MILIAPGGYVRLGCFFKDTDMNKTIQELNSIKPHIKENTYRTLLSQINKGGDRLIGASVGIMRIKRRLERKKDGRNNIGD